MSRIRDANKQDGGAIRQLHSTAFPEDEGPAVASLALNLLSEDTRPETFALIAEVGDALVGHIAFSPVTLENKADWMGYILAPLGVKPDYQMRRIGSELIESGKKRLAEGGVNVLFVYGDPKYYGKFGFKAETAASYLPPYALTYPFGWQAVVLNGEGATESAVKLSCVASLRDSGLW